MSDEFTLFWWDKDDFQHDELWYVDAERAIRRAKSLSSGPAAALGIVKRIIIIDGGDNIVFEWKIEKGVTWPPNS